MKTKTIVKSLAAAGSLFTASIFFGCLWLYLGFHQEVESPAAVLGPNAVWARHMWAGKPHTQAQYRSFFNNLNRNHITDVYFHVGPWLDADGGIPESKYAYAGDLLAASRALAPGIKAHAWIGQMTAPGGGPLDLADTRIRRRIVSSAEDFLALGFDGVHYDFEPVRSGDSDYLDLLKRTKAIIKNGQSLSVAAGQLQIAPGEIGFVTRFAPRASIWTADYFIKVAQFADQIAVMCYDTGLPADWMYGMYVREQTRRLIPLLRGRATLFMGVPTYDNSTPGHKPRAENIRTALKGIQLGLQNATNPNPEEFGVAVFAEWTTDQIEWRQFRRYRTGP